MANTLDIDTIAATLCGFIRDTLVEPGLAVEPDTPLAQLGLDSYSIIEIILFVERNYGLALPDEALTGENLHAAGTLARCIHHHLTPGS